MDHNVRIFEVSRLGSSDKPPTEIESLDVEAPTLVHARDQARSVLLKAGWQVRAISYAVDGGLVAYVVKPDEPARRSRRPSRRQGRSARK